MTRRSSVTPNAKKRNDKGLLDNTNSMSPGPSNVEPGNNQNIVAMASHIDANSISKNGETETVHKDSPDVIDSNLSDKVMDVEVSNDPKRSGILDLFTTDAETEALEISENGGIYVGLIHKIQGPMDANNSCVIHVGISNNSKKLVQLTAWGPFAKKLNSLIRLGKVIMAKGLKVIDKNDLGNYNFGNASKALKMTETSSIKVVDLTGKELPAKSENGEIVDTTINNIMNSNGPVRIRAFVRIPIHMPDHRNKTDYLCGTITDGNKILGVRVKGKEVRNNIHRGHEVELIGELFPNEENDKHHLLVEKIDHVQLIPGHKLSLKEILKPIIHV